MDVLPPSHAIWRGVLAFTTRADTEKENMSMSLVSSRATLKLPYLPLIFFLPSRGAVYFLCQDLPYHFARDLGGMTHETSVQGISVEVVDQNWSFFALEMGSETEEVIERPNDWQVAPPTDADRVLLPFRIFSDPIDATGSSLIILNTPLDEIDIRTLWNKTEFHVCADGAANRLFHYFDNDERVQYIPHYITGDCDSLTDGVKQYYQKHGAIVLPQYSQYSTDFMKSVKLVSIYNSDGRSQLSQPVEENDGLSELIKRYPNPNPTTVYIAGGIDGRFDQTFQLINQLYIMRSEFPRLKVYFITANDCIFLVPKGKNFIKYPSRKSFNDKDHMPACGLLPFGGEVVLNTEGLQYDVSNWKSYVSGPVSSNNRLVGVDGFVVQTTGDIVMNVEVSHRRRRTTV